MAGFCVYPAVRGEETEKKVPRGQGAKGKKENGRGSVGSQQEAIYIKY